MIQIKLKLNQSEKWKLKNPLIAKLKLMNKKKEAHQFSTFIFKNFSFHEILKVKYKMRQFWLLIKYRHLLSKYNHFYERNDWEIQEVTFNKIWKKKLKYLN